MKESAVINFMNHNRSKFFPNKKYDEYQLSTLLLNAPETFEPTLSKMKFASPNAYMFLSFFLGLFGIDRFAIGDVWLGLLKLFTAGGYYIFWIVDIFTAKKRRRTKNCELLLEAIRKANMYRPPSPKTVPTANTPPVVDHINAIRQTQTTPPPVQHSEFARSSDADIPISDFPDVFLSYSHRDQKQLMPLFAALQRSGMKIWFDAGIRAGSEWEEEIIEQLAKAPSFLFFVSENSLLSSNCRDELYQARKKNKKFINILLEDVDLSKTEFEWFDFRYSRYQQIPAYSMTTEEIISKVKAGLGIK